MRPADNPFSAQRIGNIPFYFGDDDWDSVIERLINQQFKGSVIGSLGTGKSTFLRGLNEQLCQRGYDTLSLFINFTNPCLSKAQWQAIHESSPETIILFDGGDILPFWTWLRFCYSRRHSKGIVITSHGKKRLKALLYTHTNEELLKKLLSKLAIDLPHELTKNAQQLRTKYQGNIREVLRDLYLVYADK